MTTAAAPCRVGIDGFNLAIPRGTGVATYARTLSHCLGRLGHPVDVLYGMDIAAGADPALREVEFFDQLATERGYKRPAYPSPAWVRAMVGAWRGGAAVPLPLTGRVDVRPVAERLPHHDRILTVQNLFGRAAHYYRVFRRFMAVRIPDPPAIMHWTYPVPVRLEGARNVYTVHDVVPLRMPYATADDKRTHFRLLRDCLRLGDAVCTVSDSSRADLLGFYPDADPGLVCNTYQAALPPPPPPGDPDQLLRAGFGLRPGGYFLFFGSVEPKKNVGRLLQAQLSTRDTLPLVLVTARSWKSDAELALLRGEDESRVRTIEYVPQDMLGLLIRGARAVAFPSLSEGFGLPVVEAMQLGTPVLTTHEGALAEVAGDAALIVDAYDPGSIAAGLRRLTTDDGLCADLRQRGLRHAARFGMAQYEDRVRTFYGAVLARPPRRGR